MEPFDVTEKVHRDLIAGTIPAVSHAVTFEHAEEPFLDINAAD